MFLSTIATNTSAVFPIGISGVQVLQTAIKAYGSAFVSEQMEIKRILPDG